MKIIIRASCILFLCAYGHIHPQELNVATFNLRNDNNTRDAANGDGRKNRYPVIAEMIRFHEFDVFGTQEGFYHQLEDLKRDLPSYDYTGLGRDDGKMAGEYSAIFYNTEKFLLEDQGDFGLSEQTDRPNKGWDAVLTNTPILKDAFEVAAFKYATNGTFNNFNPNSKTESRIDHVFLTPDFKVRHYGVLTDTYRSKLHDQEEAYQ